jgi:hypothetical protein
MGPSIFKSSLFRLFLAFSLADLGLTMWLLLVHPNWVVESNPVADWCLAQFGIAGMAIFKLAAVMVLGLVCQRLAQLRPKLSQGILGCACLVVLGVVVYSLCLMNFVNQESNRLERLAENEVRLDLKIQKGLEYAQLVDQVANRLSADQITLKQAVNHLIQMDRAKNLDWIEQMQWVYGSESLEVCLARSMIRHLETQRPKRGPDVLLRLEQQIWAEFGEQAYAASADFTFFKTRSNNNEY